MSHAIACDQPDREATVTGTANRRQASLIERARHDPVLFGELYLRHLDRLYRFLRARLGHAQDAEDVASQVFLDAWRAFPRFRGDEDAFVAWLFRIARNEAVSWQRRARPGNRSLDDLASAGFEWPSHDATPEDLGIQHDCRAELDRALAALPAEQRELIHLRYAAELSARQIGHLLGVSEIAARQRLHRALRRLREVMGDD